jgi:mono/diheme cytochrome c family protein
LLLLLIVAGWPGSARGAQPEPVERNFFETKIRPILVQSCFGCHSTAKSRGGLALDSRVGMLQGGVSGPAVVPGKADDSLLIRSIRHQLPDTRMPRNQPQLSKEVIADFVRWVNRGAVFPAAAVSKPDISRLDWWSLKPLTRPPLPNLEQSAWVRTPIDAFILARLRDKGLSPSKEADRRTLIRRLTFDLHGLPPTPEEVEAFVQATDPLAYEHLVDRLLASPRYGERWARHWLDVVHYGESNGFGMDRPRFQAWPYRDYLIQAFNADRPYTRFVQEQIAADVLFPNDPTVIPALGFAAAGPFNQSALVEQVDGTDCRKIALNLDRDDMVSSTAATFLSTTVHCARCHDHKFDAISQRDYYRLQAVFAGVGRAERPYDTDLAVAATRREWLRKKELLARDNEAAAFSPAELQTLAVAQAAWEKSTLQQATQWHVLTNLEARAEHGTTFTALPDGSFLCGGPRPDKDTYILTATMPVQGVTAVRLEVLPHDSLPKKGPGRQDNGNLHLSEFSLRITSLAAPNRVTGVAIRKATADFNQDGWDITRAIDGKKETAWGIYPKVGQAHLAVFELAQPLKLQRRQRLTFRLEQLHGQGHLIGRLRLAVTTQPAPTLGNPVPPEVLAALAIPLPRRTSAQAELVARHFRRHYIDQQLAQLPPPPKVWAIGHDFPRFRNYRAPREPEPIQVLRRGDIHLPLGLVSPGGLTCVSTVPADFEAPAKDEGARRAALARWLTHPANVLTWRSIVNRVWHYHFGHGIVDSPNDLGHMGGLPSHPELLDWLAIEFRDSGGSLKKLHRLIVTSAVYRQITEYDPKRALIDSDNCYLWRMNRGRLDAEMLRDTLLVMSGKLDQTMGGPSVMQFDFRDPNKEVSPLISYEKFDPDNPTSLRRSVYRFIFRNVNDPLLETFDAVDPSLSAAKRNETITPLQALALYNNRFVLRQCEHLAARLEREADNLPARVDRACRLVLGRPPRPQEAQLLTSYATHHGLANACRVLLNCNDFLFIH